MGLFTTRRKSAGNAIEEVEGTPAPEAPVADSSGGFRVLNQVEVQRAKHERELKKHEKSSSAFRFSGLTKKARNHSFDDESPSSSKRKSSSGTQSSRPYHHTGQYGSSSTLPSSADTESNDNMFANMPPRPPAAQHSNSSGSFSMSGIRKQLPSIPKTRTMDLSSAYGGPTSPDVESGRARAMTTSSYASTAIPPKLNTDLDFGGDDFDDMFSGLDRKQSPDFTNEPAEGRSLLAGKRVFQAEPIKIDTKLEVEPPLQSWESRGSGDNLMSPASRDEDDSPPPPPPPHKFSKYAPDTDAQIVRRSIVGRKSVHEPTPQQKPYSVPSSAASLQTPISSRSASHNTTPKAPLPTRPSLPSPMSDGDDDNLFAPQKTSKPPPQPTAAPVIRKHDSPTASREEVGRRVMTQGEFRAMQQRQVTQPTEESSDEDDYEDEEEAIRRREDEEVNRRKQQQLQVARAAIRRSTVPIDHNQSDSVGDSNTMGFPSEASLNAAEWEDEDIPLGVLAQHGFPSAARNRLPSQPANAMPSYYMPNTPTVPDRPSSASALNKRVSQLPVFARGLPPDPHNSFIGGGLVQHSNRESLGFNRGPASVYGGEHGGGMTMPMMPYHDAQSSQPSLVEQIHMRDVSKQKYTGGASSKQRPQAGPFTGLLGTQMNPTAQSMNSTRMSQMPMQNMNGMNPMMGGQMPMMGMNQMGYPMAQSNELMQMQQMLIQQQMQLQQMAQMQPMFSQQMPPQDPRMSMIQPNFGLPNQNGGFLNVPGGPPSQRPMSIMSYGGTQQRPYSTPSQVGGGFPAAPPMVSNNGYTPSIAPSERSNIGLSARYRPVVTGQSQSQDAMSTVSSMTLQASGGAPQIGTAANKNIKGILKKPQATVREDDEDDWGKLAARKSRFIKPRGDDGPALQDLVRGVDGY
ncbi:hypothetical protein BDV95DRAFT_483810 [Massariosphaeria phaeospora]|uniref:Uncharacterized protein n=1 Tax=Massariosphaeria phaeospora TaxID=100035 RepID=A0A7C8ICI7_9PLEO|nr:hypothetical protein BDV95DRAFT_483810 [Massariosphaeria phaeospora]